MRQILLLAFVIAISAGCKVQKVAAEKNDLTTKVAKYYNVENFDKLSKLSYTFNIQKDTFKSSRSWVWQIKENVVSLSSAKKNVTYKRDTIQSVEMKKVDGMFINDQYWLLFPYHLMKDSGAVRNITENVPATISKMPLTKITIHYNGKEGYTPGDAYDVYVNKDNSVAEWTYRNANGPNPTLATTWGNVQDVKGMKVATMFKNDSTKFQIYFTGVRAE